MADSIDWCCCKSALISHHLESRVLAQWWLSVRDEDGIHAKYPQHSGHSTNRLIGPRVGIGLDPRVPTVDGGSLLKVSLLECARTV